MAEMDYMTKGDLALWENRRGYGYGECGYPMDEVGWIFLIEMIGGCKVRITEEQSLKYNGFCYHVPTEKNNLFNS